MKSVFALLISVFSFSSLLGQSETLKTDQETVRLIKDVFQDKRDDIFLYPSPVNKYVLDEIRNALLKNGIISRSMSDGKGKTSIDTFLILSKAEKKYIDSCLQAYETFKWSSETVEQFGFQNVRLVDFDTLSKEDKKLLITAYQMAYPIFLREYSIALLYKGWHYYNMGLGGGGDLGLYKRENGKWKLVWRVYHWYD